MIVHTRVHDRINLVRKILKVFNGALKIADSFTCALLVVLIIRVACHLGLPHGHILFGSLNALASVEVLEPQRLETEDILALVCLLEELGGLCFAISLHLRPLSLLGHLIVLLGGPGRCVGPRGGLLGRLVANSRHRGGLLGGDLAINLLLQVIPCLSQAHDAFEHVVQVLKLGNFRGTPAGMLGLCLIVHTLALVAVLYDLLEDRLLLDALGGEAGDVLLGAGRQHDNFGV